MSTKPKRFRGMELTRDDLWCRIHEHVGKYYDPDGPGYNRIAKIEAKALRLLPLWRKWGLQALYNQGHQAACVGYAHAISSERWIPFAEMMPEPPTEGDSRILVLYLKNDYAQMLEAREEDWEDTSGYSLEELLLETDFTHWKYLQPPEAS